MPDQTEPPPAGGEPETSPDSPKRRSRSPMHGRVHGRAEQVKHRTRSVRIRGVKVWRRVRSAVTLERPDPETRFDATLFPASAAHEQQRSSEAESPTREEVREVVITEIIDESSNTLSNKSRPSETSLPFGKLGKPFSRKSPFIIGFTGGLGVICAFALVFAIQQAQSVLMMIATALFLAIGLNPIVERLIRLGLRRSWAVLVVFLGMVLAFTGACYAIVPPVIEQLQVLWLRMPAILESLTKNESINKMNERYHFLDNAQKYFTDGNRVAQLTNEIFGWGRFLLGLVFTIVTILILTLYFMAALPVIKRHFYAMMPASRRTRVMLLTDEIMLRIGGYVSGAFLVSLISGVTCYIYLRIVGIDYALPLALAAALLSLIPMVGATIAGTVLTIVAFFYSVPLGIATVTYYVLYQQIENYIIYPKIMKRSIDVPPVITVVAALIGGTLLGFVGVLLAIPTAAAILLVIREIVIPRQETT